MKFTMSQEENMAILSATPTNLDGFPLIHEMVVDWPCGELSSDRIAAAAALVFAPYLSGHQILPREISSLTAQLLEQYLEPQWVHFSPIHPANLPLPRGNRWIKLALNDHEDIHGEAIILARAGSASGWSTFPGIIEVATNAGEIDKISSATSRHRSRAQLAASILIAESLDVAGYFVTQETAKKIGLSSPVLEILNSVSLGIQVSDG